MGRLYIFMGKSAAGKDTLFQKILEEDLALKQVVPYTTRPVRQGEKEGVAYHFVSEDTMNDMRQQGRIIECRCYETVQGPWYYFTADEGYEKIRDYYGKDKVVPVYIAVDDFLRMERSLAREKEQLSPCVAEVCRRFLADEEDFSGEKLRALEITDWIDNTDLSVALEQIRSLLKKGR